MTYSLYAALRADYLYLCRGYWDGTTCASKRSFQLYLAALRTHRPSLNGR